MNAKRIAGVILLLFAAGNIAYDALVDTASMGALAILVTCLSAALGTLLVVRPGLPAQRSGDGGV